MSNDTNKTTVKRVPRFKSKKEEEEFWNTHSMLDYGKAELEEQGYMYFRNDNPKGSLHQVEKYGETAKINDPNLTEVVGVRLGKRDIKEIHYIAGHEQRPVGQLLRLWILEQKRQFIYERGIVIPEDN